jgi:hypothetical protein
LNVDAQDALGGFCGINPEMAETAFQRAAAPSVEPLVLLQYEKSEAQTDYVEFAGRPHLMMSAEGLGRQG